MPNGIKYSTTAQSLALKVGNFWIGTGDVDKSPTSSTDYWNGVEPPSGGYTVYLNKASQGPSIYTCNNDSDLVIITNMISGQSFTTATQCINWYRTQTDKMVFNIDYPTIVTNGLVLNLDAGFVPSYPRSGTTWSDISLSVNSGTLVNGPTYSSDGGGSIVFDGVNDYTSLPHNSLLNLGSQFTISGFIKLNNISVTNFIFGAFNVQTSVYTEGYGFYFSTSNLYGMNVNTLRLQFGQNDWEWNNYASNGITITDTNWHFVAVTASSLNTNSPIINFYIDNNTTAGTFWNAANKAAIRYSSNTSSIRISSEYYPSNTSYGGSFGNNNISNLSIYNRALTAAEVLQNYNAIKSRFPNIITDGLVLNLDAGNTASYPGSGTVWTDISGNGNNATLTNGPTYSSSNGGTIVFDGTNDYGTIANGSSFITTDLTIEVIVSIPNSQILQPDGVSYAGRIIGLHGTTNYFRECSMGIGNTGGLPNATTFIADVSFTNQAGNAGNGISFGTFNFSSTPLFLTYTQVGTTASTYANGNLVNTGTITKYSRPASMTLDIGYINNTTRYIYLRGGICNIKIYNRALSAAEVLQNYNAQKSRFGL